MHLDHAVRAGGALGLLTYFRVHKVISTSLYVALRVNLRQPAATSGNQRQPAGTPVCPRS